MQTTPSRRFSSIIFLRMSTWALEEPNSNLYEYLLSKLNTAGQNGQFRTPRHIIRMMVNMCDPRPGDRICDPAAGTCGFLVNAWHHLLETHTDPRDITYDEEGYPHGLTGSKLTKEGKLLDRIEGINQATSPELVPESFDSRAECSVCEHSLGGERLGEM